MIKINIPETKQERIVIVGGGFGGLTLARKLARSNYQIVLIDRNNFHQFQPLFYQVAMAGLEPSSILFPLRKTFHRYDNVYIRVAEVLEVNIQEKRLETSLGICNYDHLVVATGADTNFFGNEQIATHAIPMKSVSEALFLRNTILNDYEIALSTTDFDDRQGYIDIVIVGGGPTGVEVAGALAEMRKNVLPKDYPELDCSEIDIYLVQSSPQLLKGMSEEASQKALEFLTKLGVKVILNNRVVSYDGEYVEMKDGSRIQSRKVIWAAGITGSLIPGMPESTVTYGNRVKVNRFNQVEGMESIYAVGDIAYMEEEDYPQGHPQVAQVAIQQAKHLAKNLKSRLAGKPMTNFSYRDLGSMATIGRRLAVVDLPNWKFQGTFAWFVWLFVHLFAILGSRNKLVVFINWVWNYLFYDQSLRLIIRTGAPWKKMDDESVGDEETT